VAVWTLNRPEKLNALNRDSHLAIKEQCIRVESDDTVRAVVIRGATPSTPEEGGRSKPTAFAAGADISEFAGKNSDDVREFFANNAWEAVWNLSKPTIAMVDGFALGGGTELALACDLRVASTRAKFGQPEINLGLIPGGGGTQRLCRLLGYGKAMEMTLTGEMVGAEEALSIGLVNKVVEPEELEVETFALAENIARKSPYTVRVAKRAVRAALDLPFTEGVLTERSEFVALFDTEDKEIGVSAFLKREDAEWVGR
jgi:enoyl-CoA hydratase